MESINVGVNLPHSRKDITSQDIYICTLRDICNYTPQVLPGRSNLAHAITGFLFAVHPIHSEAVAGIVGRADLLACFLTLTSFLTYSAHCNRTRSPFPLLLALVSSTLATLAKETGISSLALCLLWELCRGEPSRKVSGTILSSSAILSISIIKNWVCDS